MYGREYNLFIFFVSPKYYIIHKLNYEERKIISTLYLYTRIHTHTQKLALFIRDTYYYYYYYHRIIQTFII